MTKVTKQKKHIIQVMKEECRMAPELAISVEEPVEVCICKLATGVGDARTKMARV